MGNIPGGQSMAVFTSDDNGKTYQTSTGDRSPSGEAATLLHPRLPLAGVSI